MKSRSVIVPRARVCDCVYEENMGEINTVPINTS